MIRLRTLGSVELHGPTGRRVESVLAQPKRLALLIYLACARPSGVHRRDQLLPLFWPDLDDVRARDALNQALRFLRNALGAEVFLRRGSEELGIDPEQLWCDVVAFRTAVVGAQNAAALETYRGDFLQGFFVEDGGGFEDWLERERTLLREQAAQATRQVADQHAAAGEFTLALVWSRRALELTPHDERALRRLLDISERAGDRAGGLRAYEQFARRLGEEYSSQPSAETRAMVERLRADRPGPALTVPQAGGERPTEEFGGRYRIERELGAGGMATVYLARDLKHNRDVAPKLLKPEIAEGLARERFMREIRIASQLQHPNIVPLFDSGESEGQLYYVMPHVEGETLRECLTRKGRLPVEEVLHLLHELASALAYAHGKGVIHRDIKPGNILLMDRRAMLTDFGIARAAHEAWTPVDVARDTLTQVGISLGTPAYMAPEQAVGSGDVDHRADLYALGNVAYEMLAGQPPFAGGLPQQVLAAHLAVAPAALSTHRPELPPALEQIVMRCLEKNPADRWQSANEILSALDTPGLAPPAPPPRSRLWQRAALAAIPLLAAGMAVTLLARKGKEPALAEPTPPTRQQFTHSGKASAPALAPDGRTIAFVEASCPASVGTCSDELVTQDLAGGQTVPLARGIDIHHPKWNPAGSGVLFQATRVQGAVDTTPGGTYVVQRLGGTSQRIGPGGAAAFSASGDTVVLAERMMNDTIRLRFLRRADTEVFDSASVRFLGRGVYDVDWSPDGKWLALLVYRAAGDRRVVLVSRRHGIVTDSTKVAGRRLVRWLPNGNAVLVLRQGGSSDDNVFQLGVDGRTGRFTGDTVTKLTIPSGGTTFDVSRDGTTLAFVDQATTKTELIAMQRDGERVTARSLLSFTGWSGAFQLSPDGSTIALTLADAQGANLYLVPFEGGRARAITSARHVTEPVWLRDQRLVFKMGLPSTQLFVVKSTGGQPRPFGPAGYTTGTYPYLQWLDDSLYVLDHTGLPHHVLILGSSGSLQDSMAVPDTLGGLRAVTPDARQLWFSDREASSPSMLSTVLRRFYSLDRATQLVKVAFDLPRNSQLLGWADSDYVFATWPVRLPQVGGPNWAGGASSPTVWRVNSRGPPTQMAVLPKDCDFRSLSMSHDGRRFVCKTTNAKTDIWLLHGVDLGR